MKLLEKFVHHTVSRAIIFHFKKKIEDFEETFFWKKCFFKKKKVGSDSQFSTFDPRAMHEIFIFSIFLGNNSPEKFFFCV